MKDKSTFGLTDEGHEIAERLKEQGAFSELVDVAKLAFATAIANDLKPQELKGSSTIWSYASLDKDGHIKAIMYELFSEQDTPYKCAESLIDQGLKLINKYLEDHPGADITDFIISSEKGSVSG